MKKTIYSFTLALMLLGSAQAQVITSDIEWQRCYGSINVELAWQIIEDTDGNFVMGGWPSSDYCFDTGSHYWLMKINSAGDTIWQSCLPGGILHSINKTIDGGFIMAGSSNQINVCYGNYDITIVKTDSIGNLEWQKCIGGSQYEFEGSIIQLADGNYVIASRSSSNDGDVSGNHGNDCWVVKLNTQGDIMWQKCIGGSDNERACTLIATSDNGFILSGTTGSNDGDITGLHGSVGTEDLLVIKFDSLANIQWQKCYGGTNVEENYYSNETITLTSDGGYAFVGSTLSFDGDIIGNHGQGDAWITKIDSTGNIEWAKCFGGSGDDVASSIQQTADLGYIITGITRSNDGDVLGNHGVADAWLIKLDSSGNLKWQKCSGGSLTDTYRSVKETNDGGLILAGQTFSNDFDVSGNHGSVDAWVVKFKPMILSFDSVGNTSCLGDDGYIGISVWGGTPPYTYTWDTNPIQSTEDISNLTAGVYSVTVTDSTGIIVSGSALVNGPSTFSGVDLAGHFSTSPIFRPGFQYQIFINVINQGCFPMNGTVVFVLDPLLNYINSVPPPDQISGDSLFWILSAFTFDSLHFTPVVTVLTDINAPIGDSVCLSLNILPFETDGDNMMTMCYPIVNSSDPNDKQVSPQGFSSHGFIANNQKMYYTVNFQNTGNADAINIYITDTLDADLNLQTLQVYSSSHPMITEIYPGNVLRFRFDNIHLPDSTTNEPLSHGYVMYEIDQNPDLAVYTEIENTAYIYFDFNQPVITNSVLNTIYDCSISYNDPVITASGPLTFCDGDNVVLDAGSGWDEYLWSTGDTTQAISVNTAGEYSVTIRVDTCWHYSDTITIIISDPQPVVTVVGSELTSQPFSSYQWYFNGNPIFGATNQTYCADTSGNYYVIVTDEYGCLGQSLTIEHVSWEVPPCDLSIQKINNTSISIYPNPASSFITVVSPEARGSGSLASGESSKYEVKIFNTQGQLVTLSEVEGLQSSIINQKSTIDISALCKGIYFLSIDDGEGRVNGKFIKE